MPIMVNTLRISPHGLGTRGFLWQAVDLVIPPFCCHCGRLGYEICPQCFSEIELLEHSEYCEKCGQARHSSGICLSQGNYFDQIHSWGYYAGPLKSIVQKLKFHRGIGLAIYLVPNISESIRQLFHELDAIVPLPLGRKRQLSRGYNQTAIIAKPLAQNLDINYFSHSVVRIRETTSQVGLSARERKANIRDAFFANEQLVQGLNILLLDDITTTGATINECAKALKLAGAASVSCFTLAKAKNLI